MAIKMIWAESSEGIIGQDGRIPWNVPGDMRFFREKTWDHMVVMGRKTWESLPKKPLEQRTNIVLTRQEGYVAEGAVVLNTIEEVLDFYDLSVEPREHLWVIGGREIYEAFLPFAAETFVTHVHTQVHGPGVFAPELPRADWVLEGTFTPSFRPGSLSELSTNYCVRKYSRRVTYA